jgi:ATP-dependent RNA helicase RhlE
VVACPGRLLDHVRRRTINLKNVDLFVLDEADQMFDMGFLPDVKLIAKEVPQKRQTLLFSATMPPELRQLGEMLLTDPTTIKIGTTAPATTISHSIIGVDSTKKTPLLLELLKTTEGTSILVFTKTKHKAQSLARDIERSGVKATSLQGNLSQGRRREALEGFKKGRYKVLVATDIASRGIDVANVSHVINYDIPGTPEAYTHRIGRTGRANRTGEALTFIGKEDFRALRVIEKDSW